MFWILIVAAVALLLWVAGMLAQIDRRLRRLEQLAEWFATTERLRDRSRPDDPRVIQVLPRNDAGS